MTTARGAGAGAILLVSDIPDHVPHYESALRGQGYEVWVASAPDHALSRATAEPENLICSVIDERVSGMSGWELCYRLRADLRVRSVPVIMLTRSLRTEALSERQRGVCQAWMARPTTGAELVRVVQHVLRRHMSSPETDRVSVIDEQACPSCDSDRIVVGIRIGAVQYYSCRQCGLYWRHDGERR